MLPVESQGRKQMICLRKLFMLKKKILGNLLFHHDARKQWSGLLEIGFAKPKVRF
jgi:hypothetical protein